jgi:hypothetical protein
MTSEAGHHNLFWSEASPLAENEFGLKDLLDWAYAFLHEMLHKMDFWVKSVSGPA